MAAYLTAAQLFTYVRPSIVADLVADDGATLTRIDLLTDTTLDAAIVAASGEIESALVAGNRYATTDLDGLTGNSAGLLQKTCAALVMVNLYDRGGFFAADEREKHYQYARVRLDRLRKGEDVFNLADQRAAGLPTTNGPTSTDYSEMNTIRTVCERRLYPERHLPIDRG